MRRKRNLGAPTAYHRTQFRNQVKAARRSAKLAVQNAERGNCAEAIQWFRRAAEAEGNASAHFETLPGTATDVNADIKRMGLATSDLNKAERKVRACRR